MTNWSRVGICKQFLGLCKYKVTYNDPPLYLCIARKLLTLEYASLFSSLICPYNEVYPNRAFFSYLFH